MSEVAETAAIEASAGARFTLLRRYGIWLAAVLLVIGLPFFARSGSALTMLSLMGIMIIFASSY
ncbi:MAG: hypothetical protein QOI40_364, partial [Alphaproteobacteria bacterium]|nr:hypothetical protein [Alphaproteobacteria bacterium]